MATSPELKEALKNAADMVAHYVQEVATMTVETDVVEIGVTSSQPQLAARTIIKLDGDSQSTLPLKRAPDGSLVVDTMVNDLHQVNVQAAKDYRKEILERLLTIFHIG